MTNTRIKVLSAIGFFLIGAFFYTQFQKSQIKQATATVAKLSATQTLINNSGTITKVIANDNQLPDNSQQKATVNALFNAGLLKKSDDGVWFPYDGIHVDFMLQAAA